MVMMEGLEVLRVRLLFMMEVVEVAEVQVKPEGTLTEMDSL